MPGHRSLEDWHLRWMEPVIWAEPSCPAGATYDTGLLAGCRM